MQRFSQRCSASSAAGSRCLWFGFGLLLLAATCCPASAQIYGHEEDSLTQHEIDTLRDTAYMPSERVMAFLKFLDVRTAKLAELEAKPRHAGRELDMHDLFAQVSDIADELDDNLDEYGPQHRDLRKSLPKLLDATDRWASTLRSAAPDDRYNIARKLALTAVTDVHDQAARLQPEQVAYFKAHPDDAKAQAARADHETFDADKAPPK